jgi:spoIIIJ-associated protein
MSNEDLIKKTVEELFEKMTYKEAAVEIKKQKASPVLVVSVQVEDASRLIGQSGSNLNDLQRILRLLVVKKISEPPLFLLDINGYREKRETFLKELSREIAEQVVKTKKSAMFQPMSSYERRIVHLELAERPEVVTESIGEEPERKVVVRPYP